MNILLINYSAFFIIGHFYVVIILIIMLLADSFYRHCSMQYKEVMGITLADTVDLINYFGNLMVEGISIHYTS